MGKFYAIKNEGVYLDKDNAFTQNKVTNKVNVFESYSDAFKAIDNLDLKNQNGISVEILGGDLNESKFETFVIYDTKTKMYLDIDFEFTQRVINRNVSIFDDANDAIEALRTLKDAGIKTAHIQLW